MCEELNTFVRGRDKAQDDMVRAGADFKLERYVDTRFASRFKVAKRLLELEAQVRAVFADAQYVSYVSSAGCNWKEKHASARDIAMDNNFWEKVRICFQTFFAYFFSKLFCYTVEEAQRACGTHHLVATVV